MNDEKIYDIMHRDPLKRHNKRKRKMKEMVPSLSAFEDEHNPFHVPPSVEQKKNPKVKQKKEKDDDSFNPFDL